MPSLAGARVLLEGALLRRERCTTGLGRRLVVLRRRLGEGYGLLGARLLRRLEFCAEVL